MPSSNLGSVSWGRSPPVWRFFHLEVITVSKTTKKKQKAIHVSNRMLTQIPTEGEAKLVMPVNCKNPCCYGFGRPFCFPCYQDMVKEQREKRRR